VIDLCKKLANSDQAILCTLHQPSAMLFSRFDRLLLLEKGGKTAYFGPIGKESSIMVDYFTRNGAAPLEQDDNPAEYMLRAIGAAPGASTDIDWHQTWRNSAEFREVKNELERMKVELPEKADKVSIMTTQSAGELAEFAAPFRTQFVEVFKRVWAQYLRTPSYLWSKYLLLIGSGLFIGLSFLNTGTSQTDLQNQVCVERPAHGTADFLPQLFAIFMILISRLRTETDPD
jgi:ATP-binding cassette subfamily G (WHITE) protein 2 (PDR)